MESDRPLWEAHRTTPSGRPRARALGVEFRGRPGAWNAITDVAGVEVGYQTMIRGEGALTVGKGPVRTGVTAIHPHGRARPGHGSTAGWWSINGNGEMTGTTWISEVGVLSLPIAITNTHAVGTAHAGLIRWSRGRDVDGPFPWSLPVAAETWDGWLNDLDGLHVTEDDVIAALEAARPGPIELGSVGGGTGMVCYGFKGGSGSASRVVDDPAGPFVVGAFVQANFGRREQLVVAGVPVGLAIPPTDPEAPAPGVLGSGSIIAIVGTDAPLLPGQCTALARRTALGVGRTGSVADHSSGDIFLAFSTGNDLAPSTDGGLDTLRHIPWGRMDAFYDAVVEAVEEAVIDAMVCNETMTGIDDHVVHALPHERLVAALSARPDR